MFWNNKNILNIFLLGIKDYLGSKHLKFHLSHWCQNNKVQNEWFYIFYFYGTELTTEYSIELQDIQINISLYPLLHILVEADTSQRAILELITFNLNLFQFYQALWSDIALAHA